MSNLRFMSLTLLPAAILFLTAQASLDRHVFGSAAVDHSGSGKRLRGTLGQPLAGSGNDLNYSEAIGFWRVLVRSAVTGVEDHPPRAEFRNRLLQNYPNPVFSHTNIRFELAERSQVSLQLFDVQGRLLGTLVGEELPPGEHTVYLRPAGLSPGLYWYRLKAGSFMQQKRIVVLN